MGETRLWGGRFRSGPDPVLMRLSRSMPAISAWFPMTSPRPFHMPVSCCAQAFSRRPSARPSPAALRRSTKTFSPGRSRLPKPTRTSHLHRADPHRTVGPSRRPTARREVAQRSGGERPPALPAATRRARPRPCHARAAGSHRRPGSRSTSRRCAPAFTHLQPAQPVVFAHQLLAHAQAFARDVGALHRLGPSPVPAPRWAPLRWPARPSRCTPSCPPPSWATTAPCENSIDAVGSRDHVVEFVFVDGDARRRPVAARRGDRTLGVAAVPLGRDSTTRSRPAAPSCRRRRTRTSPAPRGAPARLVGEPARRCSRCSRPCRLRITATLSEDKRAGVRRRRYARTVVLPAMAGLVRTLRDRTCGTLRRQATDGFTLATEVADWLARRGVPFADRARDHRRPGPALRGSRHRAFPSSATRT